MYRWEHSDVETWKVIPKQEKKKKNQFVLFGSLKSGIRESQKQQVWKEITATVNSVAIYTSIIYILYSLGFNIIIIIHI